VHIANSVSKELSVVVLPDGSGKRFACMCGGGLEFDIAPFTLTRG